MLSHAVIGVSESHVREVTASRNVALKFSTCRQSSHKKSVNTILS